MPHPKVKISDDSGNEVAVTSNALDVNIAGGATIDIGDVDMFLDGGTAVLGGAGAVASGVLRVTLASDDNLLENIPNVIGQDGLTGPTHSLSIAGTTSLGALQELTVNGSGHLAIQDGGNSLTVDNAGTFAVQSGHDITGGADGVTTDDTSGQVLGGDVDCKKIDIQAQTDNTGVIAVGFTGVDATEATGTGILLYAGDVYSLEINNLNLIYIESSVSGEGVRYTYFT